MDYCSQGQTITYVLVNIAPPPKDTLSLFNLYVALSRSSGRDTTFRLLCDFDDEHVQEIPQPSIVVRSQLEQLEKMNSETEAWYCCCRVYDLDDCSLHALHSYYLSLISM